MQQEMYMTIITENALLVISFISNAECLGMLQEIRFDW